MDALGNVAQALQQTNPKCPKCQHSATSWTLCGYHCMGCVYTSQCVRCEQIRQEHEIAMKEKEFEKLKREAEERKRRDEEERRRAEEQRRVNEGIARGLAEARRLGELNGRDMAPLHM